MVKNPRKVAIAAALALALSACGGKDQAQQGGGMPPPEVGVVKVNPGDVPLQKDLVGRLAAFRSADVRARVPGVLQRRVYAEGSDVKAGQVLFLIDPAMARADDNFELLRQRLPVACWGRLPFREKPDPAQLASLLLAPLLETA